MRKIIGGFRFCVDKYRFRAAEAIIKIAFDHSEEEKSQVMLLNDKILQRLDDLVNETDQSKKIDQKTSIEFKKMLIPSQGINVEDIFPNKSDRYVNAKNKNNLMSFSFDSVFNLVLKQLFRYENGKLVQNRFCTYVAYIVGTPGLGKNVKFLASKILLDCRVREIIKNGLVENSIFSKNFKFFYFHILTPEKQIMLKVFQEIKRDFNQVPESIRRIVLQKQNLNKFFSYVISVYDLKKIRLRLIIDEIDSVYSLTQLERQKQIDKWIQLRRPFQLPIIMIASKNNPYLYEYDPVLYFAMSTKNNIYHKKVILDNLITPKQRLNYSYGCLVFQLEKYLNRHDTMQIINNISLPITTHFSVANAVRNAFRCFNSQKYINSSKLGQIRVYLQRELNSFQYLNNFHKMQEQLKTKPQNFSSYFDITSQFLNFNCKNATQEKVKLFSSIKSESGQIKIIQKNLRIPKKLRENQQEENLTILNEKNNFFITKKQKNEVYLLNGTTTSEIQKVRMQIMSHFSKKNLESLRKKNQSLFKKFIFSNARSMFEGFICHLYNVGVKENKKVSTHIYSDRKIIHRISNISSSMFCLDEEQSYEILFKKTNQFIKCDFGNDAFDFILTSCQTNKKVLILVNTTISNEVEPIIKQFSKFKRILFEDNIKPQMTNFRRQILRLLQSETEWQLQIICFVLTAIQSQGQQKLLSFQRLQKQEQKILKNLDILDQRYRSQKTDFKKLQDIKIQRQNIIKGRTNLNSFQDEIMKYGLKNRVNIKFLQDHKFRINSDNFSTELQSDINQFPRYIFEKYREVIKKR